MSQGDKASDFVNENVFLKKSKEELKTIIAQNMTWILQNNMLSVVFDRPRMVVKPEEMVINGHLIDRIGAITNALCALGYHWDAHNWNEELIKRNDEQRAQQSTV